MDISNSDMKSIAPFVGEEWKVEPTVNLNAGASCSATGRKMYGRLGAEFVMLLLALLCFILVGCGKDLRLSSTWCGWR
jgi:hypothetical protein